jgi:hypothetical protein
MMCFGVGKHVRKFLDGGRNDSGATFLDSVLRPHESLSSRAVKISSILTMYYPKRARGGTVHPDRVWSGTAAAPADTD